MRNSFISCLLFVAVSAQLASAQYAGGLGDGSAVDTTIWNYEEVPFIVALFRGGAGDGATSDTTVWNYAVIPHVAAIFTGGSGDGATTDTTVWNYKFVPFVVALFTGGSGDGYASDSTEWFRPLLVEAKVFLEGPFQNGIHRPDSAYLAAVPKKHPYGSIEFQSTDLYVSKPDSFTTRPDSTLDWVRLSLRAGTKPDSVVGDPVAALLLQNGNIRAPDGVSPVEFDSVLKGGYYLVVDHRNHARVMSADSLDFNDRQDSWNFTDSLEAAYTAGPPPMTDLGDDKFGMYACDIEPDGVFDPLDFDAYVTSTAAGAAGYEMADCNFDARVQATDANLYITNRAAGVASQVP